jgi:hypothetical protein
LPPKRRAAGRGTANFFYSSGNRSRFRAFRTRRRNIPQYQKGPGRNTPQPERAPGAIPCARWAHADRSAWAPGSSFTRTYRDRNEICFARRGARGVRGIQRRVCAGGGRAPRSAPCRTEAIAGPGRPGHVPYAADAAAGSPERAGAGDGRTLRGSRGYLPGTGGVAVRRGSSAGTRRGAPNPGSSPCIVTSGIGLIFLTSTTAAERGICACQRVCRLSARRRLR